MNHSAPFVPDAAFLETRAAFEAYVEKGCPSDLCAAVARIEIDGGEFRWEGAGIVEVLGAPGGVVVVTARNTSCCSVTNNGGDRLPDGNFRIPRAKLIGPNKFHVTYPGAGHAKIVIVFVAILGRKDIS